MEERARADSNAHRYVAGLDPAGGSGQDGVTFPSPSVTVTPACLPQSGNGGQGFRRTRFDRKLPPCFEATTLAVATATNIPAIGLRAASAPMASPSISIKSPQARSAFSFWHR